MLRVSTALTRQPHSIKMNSDTFSKGTEKGKPTVEDSTQEWNELADAVEPLVEGRPESKEKEELNDSESVESVVDEKEEARLEKLRKESRSHEDLVKAGVERAADEQKQSAAMRTSS